MKNILHIVLLFFLILLGDFIGQKISTFFYHNIFNLVDPYQGSTDVRVLLKNVSGGALSGLLVIIYGIFFSIKNKYRLYVIAYFCVIGITLSRYIVLYKAFPTSLQFWFYGIAAFLLAFMSIIVIGDKLTKINRI